MRKVFPVNEKRAEKCKTSHKLFAALSKPLALCYSAGTGVLLFCIRCCIIRTRHVLSDCEIE